MNTGAVPQPTRRNLRVLGRMDVLWILPKMPLQYAICSWIPHAYRVVLDPIRTLHTPDESANHCDTHHSSLLDRDEHAQCWMLVCALVRIHHNCSSGTVARYIQYGSIANLLPFFAIVGTYIHMPFRSLNPLIREVSGDESKHCFMEHVNDLLPDGPSPTLRARVRIHSDKRR